MEVQEEKRKEYREIMKDIPAEKIFYIDESKIEEKTVKRLWNKRSMQQKRVASIIREATLSLSIYKRLLLPWFFTAFVISMKPR